MERELSLSAPPLQVRLKPQNCRGGPLAYSVMAEGSRSLQISPDRKWWWDGAQWRPIASPLHILVMRVLNYSVVGVLCWAVLPVGLAIVMAVITPTYWRPMFSVAGVVLLTLGIVAIAVSIGLAAIVQRFARPTRGAVLAGLGLVTVALIVQFLTLWVVMLGPAVLILLKPT